MHVRQPMVTPCGHLLCLDCTATSRESCPLPDCGAAYLMQVRGGGAEEWEAWEECVVLERGGVGGWEEW